MKRYSITSLLRNAMSYHEDWQLAWRSPEPKPEYDVIIIGGGGHGLATACYLAKDHGITNVAVVEKGWLGGGNTGRNTMTIRSNYLREQSIPFMDRSLEMYEELSSYLNYNVMFSQRGQITFIQSAAATRRAMRQKNTMHLYGADYRAMSFEEMKRRLPIFENSPNARHKVSGAVYQKSAGIARHDAVAWGFARMADAHGVDILQNCEVQGILRENGRAVGVETTKGIIKAKKVGMAVAGHASVVANMAGFRMPIETQPLQAFVSTPIKPVLDAVVVCGGYGAYVMQSDKGEIVAGSGADPYPSYAQRGTPPIIEGVITAVTEVFPVFRRLQLLRHWAGMIDICYDGSPIISKTPVEGFYCDVGWGSGGFKATPISGKTFAHLIARDEPHELAKSFTFDRFEKGKLVLEGGVSYNRG